MNKKEISKELDRIEKLANDIIGKYDKDKIKTIVENILGIVWYIQEGFEDYETFCYREYGDRDR